VAILGSTPPQDSRIGYANGGVVVHPIGEERPVCVIDQILGYSASMRCVMIPVPTRIIGIPNEGLRGMSCCNRFNRTKGDTICRR
jgi:hypothetical protein